MRYVWDANERYLQETSGRRFRLCKRLILSYLRVWDAQAADRPDRLVANSEYTRARIAKYYRRESQVVYPSLMPLTESPKATTRDFFLVVSRLTKSKHIDSVVEAFNKLGLPLVVVGRGPEREHLKHLAGPTVRIVGWKSDEVLAKMYARARAVVFPAEEDFGLVMAEAQAAGAPVIACERGGSREIVSPGVTGEFFIGQTPEVIADGVRRFLTREGRYDTAAMRACAERFSRQRFEQAFRDIVRETLV
jgi:glycosyltransferase involved in cell wall biosynthesis